MTFDDTLHQVLETLTGRLRDEIARELRDVAAEVAASARTDREAAVNEAETRARSEAERVEKNAARTREEAEGGAEARLLIEVAAAEARGRDQAEAKVREQLAEQDHRTNELIAGAVSASREEARSAGLSASERLVDAVRAMDREQSLSAILDTLANCAGREAARIGLLLARAGDVRGELRGWRFIGFGPAFEVASTIVIPAAESGIVAEAIRTGDAVSADMSGALAAPVFAALPGGRQSLAVPVTMSGEVVAVLYADQGADQGTGGEAAQRPSTLTWPDAIEIMARHAARCLEAATAVAAVRVLTERPAAATRPPADKLSVAPPSQGDEDEAARRDAQLLVSEIRR